MVDLRLAEYIKETLEHGYNQNVIRQAILHSGYSEKVYEEALYYATNAGRQPNKGVQQLRQSQANFQKQVQKQSNIQKIKEPQKDQSIFGQLKNSFNNQQIYAQRQANNVERAFSRNKSEGFLYEIGNSFKELSPKKATIFIYTLLSTALGLFSMEFIGLSLTKNVVLNYIFLFALSSIWAIFVFLVLKRIVNKSLLKLGYLIPLGAVIDLIVSQKIKFPVLGIIFVIFFYSSAYFIMEQT